MKRNFSQAEEIMRRYANGQASEQEKVLVEQWLLVRSQGEDFELSEAWAARELDEIWKELNTVQAKRNRPSRRIRSWSRVAAAVVILGGFWFIYTQQNESIPPQDLGNQTVLRSSEAIEPGRNQATLTLADGKTIRLEDWTLGTNLSEGEIRIVKSEEGLIRINIEDKSTAAIETKVTDLNHIETPRGGHYQILLPDGTRVWLNAASALHFPSHFAPDHRTVRLEGEGYFEVAPDKKRPFLVLTGNQEVKALGTAFNISNYADMDAVKTTLLEGKVQVRDTRNPHAHRSSVLLNPGQQAIFTNTGFQVLEIDTAQVLDWKNGDFIFQNQTLNEILGKIARWYDVDVEYLQESASVNQWKSSFSGQVKRSKHLPEVLNVLEVAGGLKFNLQGRKIFVTQTKNIN